MIEIVRGTYVVEKKPSIQIQGRCIMTDSHRKSTKESKKIALSLKMSSGFLCRHQIRHKTVFSVDLNTFLEIIENYITISVRGCKCWWLGRW